MNVIADRYSLYEGDCLEVMKTFEANSIDTVICDPPYGLKFMSKNWDHGIPGVPFWAEMLRVAKPGAILMAFGGTRTHHRLMVAIEDAGWELRDTLMWLYGSGFPKSHDISAAIDRGAGVEREIIGTKRSGIADGPFNSVDEAEKWIPITAPATDAAREWAGWGTALKPAWEPIIVAMKPLTSTFAANALAHGVAGLNIDGCRIGNSKNVPASGASKKNNGYEGGWGGGIGREQGTGFDPAIGRWPANLILDQSAAALLDEMSGERPTGDLKPYKRKHTETVDFKSGCEWETATHQGDTGGASRYFTVLPDEKPPASGRWPSNLLLDQTAAALLDEMSGELTSGSKPGMVRKESSPFLAHARNQTVTAAYGDTGGASRYFTVLPDSEPRFFYSSKASRGEREEGLDGLEPKDSMKWSGGSEKMAGIAGKYPDGTPRPAQFSANGHPTVKPLSLMRWLVRLTKTPTGGSVLDPFGGSGTTVIACLLEGRHCTYIDKEREYFEITRHRSEHWQDEASTEPRKLRGKADDLADMPLFADIGG